MEFVIEEISEFACPKCGNTVPADSTRCHVCGAHFKANETAPEKESGSDQDAIQAMEGLDREKLVSDLKERREEFSRLVSEIRPLLILAKDFGIDTTVSRRLIDKAVRLGRQRDVDSAVKTLRECHDLLTRSISDRAERDIMYLENLADVATKMSSDPSSIQKVIADAKAKRAAGDLEGALADAKSGKRLAEQLTGQYVEAHEMYEALEKLVLNSERFYLDVREARKLLNESREAGKGGDWTTMGILARKGREELNRSLPDVIKTEVRRAKQALLEAKASGKDVSAMVKILKDAGVALKRERYEEALERLNEFRAEEKSV